MSEMTLDKLSDKFDERWQSLTGNGEAGLFERVRNLERWARLQQKIAWLMLSTVLLLAVKAVWELLRETP